MLHVDRALGTAALLRQSSSAGARFFAPPSGRFREMAESPRTFRTPRSSCTPRSSSAAHPVQIHPVQFTPRAQSSLRSSAPPTPRDSVSTVGRCRKPIAGRLDPAHWFWGSSAGHALEMLPKRTFDHGPSDVPPSKSAALPCSQQPVFVRAGTPFAGHRRAEQRLAKRWATGPNQARMHEDCDWRPEHHRRPRVLCEAQRFNPSAQAPWFQPTGCRV
jgi:hypothetical protein